MKPIVVRNLHGHVIQAIGQRIVAGDYQPGDTLPREEALADSLDISRTALREAMKVLSAKGLVESRPKIGTRVRESRYWHQLDADVLAWRCASMPTADFVRKLVEMREMIEPAAADAAARRCGPEQLEQLDAAYRAMETARSREDWAQADLAFHEAILAATNNELITSLFAVIETALGTFFVLSARNAKNFKYSLPQHGKVLEAIRRRQPQAARRAMHALVVDSQANMTRVKSNAAESDA